MDIIPVTPTDALKSYRLRAAYLANALDATEADIESILVNTQDLLKRARKGFTSERVNMKSDDGTSALTEQLPAIEIACLNIQLKVNEMLIKVLEKDELPDTTTIVNITSVALEERL